MKILSIKDYSGRLNASVQQSGRLVFTGETVSDLQLKDKMPIMFAQDDDGTLYCSFPDEDNEEGESFRIRKAGSAFYVPTANLFSALGVDYENFKVSYNLVRDSTKDNEMNGKAYKMELSIGSARTLRKNKENEQEDSHNEVDSDDPQGDEDKDISSNENPDPFNGKSEDNEDENQKEY